MVSKEKTEKVIKGKKDEKARYVPRRKPCPFCKDKVVSIDYKDSARLVQYISSRGKIEPRRRTGCCAKHQRALAIAIKRARHIALLPFAPEHIYKMGGIPGGVVATQQPTQDAGEATNG